ncbi:PREDICTED: polycomb group RING finger protein 3 isoform X1 [Crocodylus porosus]|uniref:polycomb group RING finger protein 3 isoform X1 n=2 Tax=Crocodylus porosus TaxID=8502 RepID=UPI00093D30C5|nr:PREDICTED: polycomb group RING finger protein 3 isoform X1 [Crocodylus porosus]
MHNFYLISTPELLSNAVNLQTPKMLTRKIKLWDINAHITCRLCNGYLIDATTVTECLHTFCRSCLVKYLEENNTCPTCRIVIHQSHPLQYIGHDRTMQDIVYKLVPGLQEAEMKKQREFYHKLGMEVPGDIKGETCSAKQHLDSHRNGETKTDESSNKEASEEKQEEDNDYHRSDEQVSICLECNSSKLRGLKRKWIRCSAQATVLHLKKFIAKKLNLSSFNELDILCNEEILGKDHTLKFVVVTRWRFKKTSAMTQEMNQVEDFGADFDINLDSDLRWPDFSSCFLSSASQPALLRQADTYK